VTKPPIDWRRAHERLERARLATEEALSPPPERAEAVLAERARSLARRPPAEPSAGELLEVLTFVLGRERYALESRHVREVVRLVDFTPVPGTPPFFIGIVNLRGEILPVVDLRRFFDTSARGVTDLARIVVLGGARADLGLLADRVEDMRSLRRIDVLEAPPSVSARGREHLLGVTAEALCVLDGEMLLRDDRLVVDGPVQALAPAPSHIAMEDPQERT
jgi:purine-binding chemotaxis protein CheW